MRVDGVGVGQQVRVDGICVGQQGEGIFVGIFSIIFATVSNLKPSPI